MKLDSRHSVTSRVSKTLAQIFLTLICLAFFIVGLIFFSIHIEPHLAHWAHGFTNKAIPVLISLNVIAGGFLLTSFLYQYEDRDFQYLSLRGYKCLTCFLGLLFISPMYVTKNIDVDTLDISHISLFYFHACGSFFGPSFLSWLCYCYLSLLLNPQKDQQG